MKAGRALGRRQATWGSAVFTCLVLSFAGAASAVHGQAWRPSEEAMFGGQAEEVQGESRASDGSGTESEEGPTSQDALEQVRAKPRGQVEPARSGARPAEQESHGLRDLDLLGFGAGTGEPSLSLFEDPLTLGGSLLLRTLVRRASGQRIGDEALMAPFLLDGYFDVRPSDRVRVYGKGRLLFDAAGTAGYRQGGVGTTVPVVSSFASGQSVKGVLDQLWLSFDVDRIAYITVGRQHVRWGTGKYWMPTDYLHPTRRNPVDTLDARPGATMLKAHVPWEAEGWNFYGLALFERPPQLGVETGRYEAKAEGAGTLKQLGFAWRAELVWGTAELGLDMVGYLGELPRYGLDLSLGLGAIDVYCDVGLRHGSEIGRRKYRGGPVPLPAQGSTPEVIAAWVDQQYPIVSSKRMRVQGVGGVRYDLAYGDNDLATFTAEYFYNGLGYRDSRVYTGLVLADTFDFFYSGLHYAAFGVSLPEPGALEGMTFAFATLGNLSDRSFLTRLDYLLDLGNYLQFQAFVTLHYGTASGEFRFGLESVPDLAQRRLVSLPSQRYSAGVGMKAEF